MVGIQLLVPSGSGHSGPRKMSRDPSWLYLTSSLLRMPNLSRSFGMRKPSLS